MSIVFANKCSKIPGVYVNRKGLLQEPVIFFDKCTTSPTSSGTTNAALYVNSSGQLEFAYNGTATVLGAPGASSTTWESLFLNDTTLAMSTGGLTMSESGAYDLLTLNKTNASTGAVLTIANSGTGNDVTGPAWSIISTGSVGILELASGGTINATGGALTIGASGSNTTLAGALVVDEASTLTGAVTATASVTITGTADSNCLTVTAGDVLISNGKIALTNDDTDTAIAVTANSVTTGSVISVTANGVTSGNMLYLVTSDSGFSGAYIKVSDGSDIFTVGDEGATTIAGADGTNVFVITAGDVNMANGSITVVDADDAASLSVTNNSAATASMAVLAGSGTFTGSTTTSFFTITPSGLTTGTAVYLPVAAMTEGKGLHVTAGATVTSGSLLYVQDTGANCAITSGNIAYISEAASAITGTVNRTGASLNVSAARTTTSGTVADDYDTALITRADTINGAGSMSTAGSVLKLARTVTNTSGTITDTVVGLEISMDGDGTGAAISATHAAATGAGISLVNNALTTGTGIVCTSSSTGVTTGSLLKITTATTGAVATNGVISFVSSGAHTSTSNIGFVHVADATATGTAVDIAGSALTTGELLRLVATSAVVTTGTVLNIVANSATTCTGLLRMSATALTDGFLAELTGGGANVTASGGGIYLNMGASTNGYGLRIASTGTYTGTVGLLSVTSAANTGIVSVITANSLTTGSALLVTSSGTITSSGQGLVNIVGSGITTGDALKIDLTEDTLAGGNYINCYDDSAGASVFKVAENGALTIAGSAAETDAITVTAGDLSLTSGLINLETGTGTCAGNAVTISKATGTITSSTNNLAADTSETITLTNTRISATSHVVAWIEDGGTGGEVVVMNCKPGAGSATISVRNVSASAAMSSAYKVGFAVINK